MTRSFKNLFLLSAGLLIFGAFATPTLAQDAKGGKVEKTVFWEDRTLGVEVFLSDSGKLTVISKKNIRVYYHTSINFSTPVDKELIAISDSKSPLTYFQVKHNFSRTTIWMALEFTIDGLKANELTRTFYNDISETVPNGQFGKSPKKPNH